MAMSASGTERTFVLMTTLNETQIQFTQKLVFSPLKKSKIDNNILSLLPYQH